MCEHDSDILEIKRLVKQIQTTSVETQRMVSQNQMAIFGNGDPEHGLMFRVSFIERRLAHIAILLIGTLLAGFVAGVAIGFALGHG